MVFSISQAFVVVNKLKIFVEVSIIIAFMNVLRCGFFLDVCIFQAFVAVSMFQACVCVCMCMCEGVNIFVDIYLLA